MLFTPLKRLQDAVRKGTAPDVVVLENVTGFITVNRGREFKQVVTRLDDIGYFVGPLTMDAVRWLPQTRNRLFIVAVRKGIAMPPGLVAARPSEAWSTPGLRKAVKGLNRKVARNLMWFSMPLPKEPPRTLVELLEPVDDAKWVGPDKVAHLFKLANPLARRRIAQMAETGVVRYGTTVERTKIGSSPAEREATVRVNVCGTLMSSTTGSSRQRLLRVHGDDTTWRELTPREPGRVMGAPDSYILPRGRCPALELLGDAVAVPVVRHLVMHVVEPIVAAAVASKSPPPPRNGRRPIKDGTTQVSCYLPYPEHRRCKDVAVGDGVPLSSLLLVS